jgi:hypothetical protein
VLTNPYLYSTRAYAYAYSRLTHAHLIILYTNKLYTRTLYTHTPYTRAQYTGGSGSTWNTELSESDAMNFFWDSNTKEYRVRSTVLPLLIGIAILKIIGWGPQYYLY